MFSRPFHPKILAVNCGVFGMVQFDQPLAVDFATEALKIVGWKLLQVARKQFQMLIVVCTPQILFSSCPSLLRTH